jgi:hypothetical protein
VQQCGQRKQIVLGQTDRWTISSRRCHRSLKDACRLLGLQTAAKEHHEDTMVGHSPKGSQDVK